MAKERISKMNYQNPVIRGFNPDPSICRVGDDYYLVTSTFEYFPGIPVYHSRDMVNWEHIANAVTRESQLPLERVSASGGIWAPTIRYNEGRFFITATFSETGNFIIYADDPRGEWSDPVWVEMDGIDPSMLFDNGRMYYCANDYGSRGDLHETEGISVAEVDPFTGKVKGEIRRVWDGMGGGWIEAPHIYRIGERYYILAAEGGTGVRHHEVAARSNSIFGPYEPCPFNPILTNRNDTSKQINCSGHADLIEGSDGEWWLVHLGTRPYVGGKTTLGRETFLTRAEWKDGWPVAAGKRAVIENEAPKGAVQKPQCGKEFDFKSGEWEPQWLFVRSRDDELISRGGGKMVLKPDARLTDEKGSISLAALRQPDLECVCEAELDFEPENDGDEAGMAAYLTPRNIYRICKRRDGGRNYIVVQKKADDFEQEIYREAAPDGRLILRINADREKYSFSYSVNGSGFIDTGQASAKFLTTDAADRCFTGTVIGVYAQSDTKTDAAAMISRFCMKC